MLTGEIRLAVGARSYKKSVCRSDEPGTNQSSEGIFQNYLAITYLLALIQVMPSVKTKVIL